MQNTIFTSARNHRGACQIWIGGGKLESLGWSIGERYNLEAGQELLKLSKDPEGAYKVSKSKGKPVIDLTAKKLANTFEIGTRVIVLLSNDEILIKRHHEDIDRDNRETRLFENMHKGELTHASLFTGGGISTEAIHQACIDSGLKSKTAFICESVVKYSDSALQNCISIDTDTVLLSGPVEEMQQAFFSPVDILSFSMPCAGHSKAGRSKHKLTPEQHEGATALFGVYNALKVSNPSIVISENVTSARNSAAYDLLKAELLRRGYYIAEQDLNSEHTDSIENRSRYWLVAVSAGILSSPFALNIPGCARSGRTINSILDNVIPDSAWSENQYLKDKSERDAKQGKGFASRQLLNGSETNCGTIGRFYNKRRSTEPFLARADGKERLLTPAEHARVKSIPEYLIAGQCATTAHEILGQSVDYRQPYLVMLELLKIVKQATGRGARAA